MRVSVLSWPGRAGRPPGRVLVRLTFSCDRCCCSLCLIGPVRAGDAQLMVVLARFLFLLCTSLVSGVPCFLAVGALGLGVLVPPPLFFSFFLSAPPACFFSFFSCLFFFSLFQGFFFLLFSSFVFSSGPWCAGGAVLGWCVVGCGGCWCVLFWALCFGGGRCALALCRSVLPACASSLCFVACCVARARRRRAGGIALSCAASGWFLFGVARPQPTRVLCAVFVLLGVWWLSPPPRLVVVSCVVLCRVSCRVVLRSVVCFVLCPVLCGVLVFGWVLAPCCSAQCCAGSCCSVFVVLCCCALLRSLMVSLLRCSLPFCGVSVSVLCLCRAVLVYLRCCYLCGALLPLPRWLVFFVLACCVCVFAVGFGCPLLSPGRSWWILVSCFGGVLWCVPWSCAAPCCCTLCRLALCCCALFFFCFALFRAVGRWVVSWGAVRCAGVMCLPALYFVLSSRAVCVLLCCVAAWCDSPLRFVPCASWGVVVCVPCPLRPLRYCCEALLSLDDLLRCAVPRGAVL